MEDERQVQSTEAPLSWDVRQVCENAWDTTFRRGKRAWFSLVTVCFIFSFVGAANASQSSFVDVADQLFSANSIMLPGNVGIIVDYARGFPILNDLINRSPGLALALADSVSKSATWAIHLLALNPRYLARNPEEAMFNVLMVAAISIALRFLVQNVIVVGQHRYVMESRFAREVPWRRMLAPFHLHTLFNVFRVMVCYHVSLLLWWLTIVGGPYKALQYAMVPYLLAENPYIGWRDARDLSIRMTEGHKRQMLGTWLSYVPMWLLRLVPVLGLLTAVPLEAELGAELYFTLRANPELDRAAFAEPSFDAKPYVRLTPEERQEVRPSYRLRDLNLERTRTMTGPLAYPVVDLIYCFFAFCFVGWVWEVGLHFVQMHELVNRGTLYGPWIPIYGVGGVGIIVLLDRYKHQPERLFGLTIVLCAVLEYAASFLLDFMFNASYWDYKGMLFNINGRICLAGLLAFGFGGLVAIYIAAPVISRKVQSWPVRQRTLGAMLLVLAVCGDLGYCLFHGFNSGSGVGEEL